jgi:protein TonB
LPPGVVAKRLPVMRQPATQRPQDVARPPVLTGPATAAPAPNTPPSSSPVISPSWQSALAAWLEAHKSYPEPARRRGEQGTVSVRFSVDQNGHVLNVDILHSSGSKSLDAAAQGLLSNARVPPLAPPMPQQVTVTVAIRYVLQE